MTDLASRRRRQLVLALLTPGLLPRMAGAKDRPMRIFITGSTDGLGRAAAAALIAQGHQVVLHARSAERARALADLAPRAAGVAVGDLASAEQTKSLAEQVDRIGRMDAVIHNAGIFRETSRGNTPEGHAKVLAVNTLAPYLLTEWMKRPDRLIYLSSSMHRGGDATLHDIDWSQRSWDTVRAYSESKLYVTALAFAAARRWPKLISHAVDPGWVPTKMGGQAATDDLEQGHLTQTWLATSGDADVRRSGGYWYHRRRQDPAPETLDASFQDRLIARLAELTGVEWSRS